MLLPKLIVRFDSRHPLHHEGPGQDDDLLWALIIPGPLLIFRSINVPLAHRASRQ